MTSADWEEVKRLAADFQRAQLTSSLQRLSERNCIEVITKLVELNLIDIFHTSNGKEYITPDQLFREVKDELFVHGGRINLVDLSVVIGVDLNLIETNINRIIGNLRGVTLTNGQLISPHYLDSISEEINENLQQKGCLTIADLAVQYDLPGLFLLENLEKRLGNIIQGQQDEQDRNAFFTDAFVANHRARIAGVLSGITQPTTVSSIISLYNLQERLFFNITDKLIALKRISGIITGGKQANKAVYVPDIYTRTQNEYIDNFLNENGYLEFSEIKKLGIPDPESYIKKRYSKKDLIFLKGWCISRGVVDQVEAVVDEALVSGGVVEVDQMIPSVFSSDIGRYLIELCLKRREHKASTGHIFCDTIIVSDQVMVKLSNILDQMMPLKAKEAIDKGVYKQQVGQEKLRTEDDGRNKRDDRRKKATGGKSGGGIQGRETKTKSTKNKHKGRKQQDSDSEDDSVSSRNPSQGNKFPFVEFLSTNELHEEILKLKEFSDMPEELIEEVGDTILPNLTKKFQEVLRTTFLATVTEGGNTRKKTHQQLQEKVNSLLISIKLAEKGAKLFNEDTCNQLKKHLLKTYCSEVLNELILFLADESLLNISSDKDITADMRLKILNKLEDDLKEPLLAVHKALNGSIEDFLSTIDNATAAADLLFKKKDNKKERSILLNHRAALIEQLEASTDAALSLHLACLLLFHSASGNFLHATGRFVPQIISFLRESLSRDQYEVFHEYQVLVMKTLTLKKDDEELSVVKTRLEELTPTIKTTAITFKRTSTSLPD